MLCSSLWLAFFFQVSGDTVTCIYVQEVDMAGYIPQTYLFVAEASAILNAPPK